MKWNEIYISICCWSLFVFWEYILPYLSTAAVQLHTWHVHTTWWHTNICGLRIKTDIWDWTLIFYHIQLMPDVLVSLLHCSGWRVASPPPPPVQCVARLNPTQTEEGEILIGSVPAKLVAVVQPLWLTPRVATCCPGLDLASFGQRNTPGSYGRGETGDATW